MHSLSFTHTHTHTCVSVSGEDLVTPVLLFFHAERLYVLCRVKKKYSFLDRLKSALWEVVILGDTRFLPDRHETCKHDYKMCAHATLGLLLMINFIVKLDYFLLLS